MKKPLPKLLSLFLSFLKIGAFTFGGGYAMIALLENEFVARKGWLGRDEFLDVLAVSESTPGPIAVNTATYIGYKVAGVLGSVLSTLAVCLPAFAIIFVISLFFDRFLALTYVGYAFRGVQVAVVYLIASAGIKVLKGLKRDFFTILLAVLVFAAFVTLSLFAVSFSSVFYILICGVLGLALYFVRTLKARGDRKSDEPSAPAENASSEEPTATSDPADAESGSTPGDAPKDERREEE